MSNGLPVVDSQDSDLLRCAVCNSTLLDAVLLKCLHSTCRSCMCDSTVNITCPVCRAVTESSQTKANLVVSALAHRSQVMENMLSCTHCTAEGQHNASSVAWCSTCQQSLCADCERYHNRYNSKHNARRLDEHTVLSELYRPPSRLCAEHNQELTLACFTCQDGRCFKCAHDCYTASHNIQVIDSPVAVDQLKVRITDARRVISDLNLTEQLLQSHFSLPQKVTHAMEESRALLRNAKKTAINSITNAYDKADQSLVECWEIVASKAELRREFVESLKNRLDWAKTYCQVALRTEDMTALLPQLDTLSSCLCSLLEETRLVKEPVDPMKLISMNVCLPCDLDLITSNWIGEATLVSDRFDCPVNDILNATKNDYYARKVSVLNELEDLLKKQKEQQESVEHDRLLLQELELQLKLSEQELAATENEKKNLLDQQQEQQKQLDWERRTAEQLKTELKSKTQQLAAPTKPQNFDSNPLGTFKGPGCCWDVSVTPKGSLLVAAAADGLKEYDATTFREIVTWKPNADLLGKSNNIFVRTVDTLSDGRALIGLDPNLIVLLRSYMVGSSSSSSTAAAVAHLNTEAAAGAWQVERYVAADLQGPPRRLSTWDDRLLAALEDRYDESSKSWCCGPRFVLLSLSDSDELLHRQKLDYNACSVSLTDRGVIVASEDKVELADTACSSGGNKKCYLVDCYSHVGVRLWRHVFDDGAKVMSVCSDAVGRVFAAKYFGPAVALSVDDGRELKTAMTLNTTDIGTLYVIALDKATQCRMVLLTKVGDDQPNSINVFPVS